jgi:CheY-like chemotaxis protein
MFLNMHTVKRILLIDDDPVSNFINHTLIKTIGPPHDVVVAEDGQQGLDILVAEANAGRSLPDVILLDINMPVVDGFQFLTKLNSLGIMPDIGKRISILSSSHSQSDKRRANSLGITSYFIKPMTVDDVRKLLG